MGNEKYEFEVGEEGLDYDILDKDIIDIQIGVKDFSNITDIENILSPLGLNFIKDIKQDHVPFKDFDYFETGYEKRFFTGIYKDTCYNIHVRVLNAKNWNFAIDFRNFLIKNKEIAKSYAQIKERISNAGVSVKDYCLIKDPVCDLIYTLFKQKVT